MAERRLRPSEKERRQDDDDDDDGSVEVCGTISIPEFSRDCAEDEECGYEIQFNLEKSELRTREDACSRALKSATESFVDVSSDRSTAS